ncbi:hypothetical protein ScPMuIL_010164 [Solemya velum]
MASKSIEFNSLIVLIVALFSPSSGQGMGTPMVLQQLSGGMGNMMSRLLNQSGVAVSKQCETDFQMFRDALTAREYWALRMFDAASKVPSGIFDGNMNWIGSYEECLDAVPNGQILANQTQPFKPQYCTVTIPVPASLFESFAMANFRIGVCIPNSCFDSDARSLLVSGFVSIPMVGEAILNQTRWHPEKSPVVCQTDPPGFDTKAKAAITVCVVLGCVLILGTGYDILKQHVLLDATDDRGHKQRQEGKHTASRPRTLGKVFLSFSLYTNVPKFLNTNQGGGTLSAVNGIRFFSMTWVIFGHVFQNLFAARNAASVGMSVMRRASMEVVTNAFFSTDSFFLLSGLLVSYLSLKEMKKVSGAKGWAIYYVYYYLHRFWRLTPVYGLLMLVYISMWPYTGDGPNWTPTSPERDDCRESWWLGLLYVNNFFVKDPGQCMGWVWYLANDMQMYWASPIVIIPLFLSPVFGGIWSFLSLLAVTIATGVISWKNNLATSMVIEGMQMRESAEYYDLYYVKPWCRMGPFIVGIITGYILHKTNCKINIRWYWNTLGWLLAIGSGLTVLYGLHGVVEGRYANSVEVAALYNALSRTIWAAAVCWVILSCATGHGGFINTFLSWKVFVPLARLTYCAYLVHPCIIAYFSARQRTTTYYTDIDMVCQYLGHMCMSLMAAFVLSMAFEAPMIGLERALVAPHLKHKKK